MGDSRCPVVPFPKRGGGVEQDSVYSRTTHSCSLPGWSPLRNHGVGGDGVQPSNLDTDSRGAKGVSTGLMGMGCHTLAGGVCETEFGALGDGLT